MPACSDLVRALILTLCVWNAAWTDVQPKPPSDEFTFSTRVDLVLMDVSVKDSKGGYATDLRQEDFQLFEDGHPRPITYFSSIDAPVTVGLVVDSSGSMRAKRQDVIMAGLAFAEVSNPADDFFVVNFNDVVKSGLPPRMPFTDKLEILRSALYRGEPTGQTALYDAIAYSLKHLELSRHQKRTLIVVSDGGDNVSKTHLEHVMRLIASSRATIYTVGLYDEHHLDLRPAVLKRLAKASGGRYFQPEGGAEISRAFHEIARDIRTCYSIGFIPDTNDSGKEKHAIKLLARHQGRKLVVRARTSYSTGAF
jgi:Ca-activated chloride channel homolog